MEKNENLPLIEVIFILFLIRLTPTYLSIPPLNVPPANQDVWFVEIVAVAYTIALCFPILFLSNKFNNLTFIEIMQTLCGHLIGSILGIFYIAFMLFIAVSGSADIILFLGSAIIPETPSSVILIFHLLTCSYIAYKGISSIGRSTVVYSPIIIFIIILFSVLNIDKMTFKTFLPVLADSKLWQINVGAWAIATRFYDIIILCMVAPNIKNKKNISKSFFYALALFFIVSILMTVSIQATLGIEQAKHARYSYLTFTRQTNVFDFIQRIESLNIMSWFFARFIKVSVYIYAAALSLKKIFNTKTYNKFLIPISIIIYLFVMYTSISKSVVYNKILSYKVFPYISCPFLIMIPLFLLVIYFFRRKNLNISRHR